MFPAPLEVDREIYDTFRILSTKVSSFPAPLEVDRDLYTRIPVFHQMFSALKFPAPLEVDRELYKEVCLRLLEKAIVSYPSLGR